MLAVYDLLKPDESATDVARAFNCSSDRTLVYATKKVYESEVSRQNLKRLKKHLQTYLSG